MLSITHTQSKNWQCWLIETLLNPNLLKVGKNQFPTTQLTKNNHKHWLGIFYTFISLLSIPSSSRRLFSIQIHSMWKSENYQISQYQYRFPCIKLTRSFTPDPLTLFDKFYTILLLFLNKKKITEKRVCLS